MKTLPILVATLCCGALSAQEYTQKLDGRVILFGEVVRPAQFTLASVAGGDAKDQADAQVSLGVRFIGEIAMAPGFYYELGGRTESASNLLTNGDVGGGVTLNATQMRISYSYWMVGAAYMKTFGRMTLGAHLEARGEAIRAVGTLVASQAPPKRSADVGNTYLRPWVRLSADFTLGSGTYRPILGVEGAFALTRMTQVEVDPALGAPTGTGDGYMFSKRTLNSMAPRFSGGVYAGIRF